MWSPTAQSLDPRAQNPAASVTCHGSFLHSQQPKASVTGRKPPKALVLTLSNWQCGIGPVSEPQFPDLSELVGFYKGISPLLSTIAVWRKRGGGCLVP